MGDVIIFDSERLFGIARAAAERARSETAAASRDDVLIALLFSAAAVEAFVNEIAEWAILHEDSLGSEFSARYASLLEEAEANRGSVRLKVQLASIAATGRPLSKSEGLYQNRDLLIKLRDGLVHLKPERYRWSEETPPPKHHKLVVDLFSRGF